MMIGEGSDAPELRERLVQLGAVDRARAVAVKVAEDVLPILDVLPQAGELGKGRWERVFSAHLRDAPR